MQRNFKLFLTNSTDKYCEDIADLEKLEFSPTLGVQVRRFDSLVRIKLG